MVETKKYPTLGGLAKKNPRKQQFLKLAVASEPVTDKQWNRRVLLLDTYETVKINLSYYLGKKVFC